MTYRKSISSTSADKSGRPEPATVIAKSWRLGGWTMAAASWSEGTKKNLVIHATPTVRLPCVCVKCGAPRQLYRHGTKLTQYRDLPIKGRAVVVSATLQRFKCRACGETFLQPAKNMAEHRRMTERCRRTLVRRSATETYHALAEWVGCDDKTVRLVAQDGDADQKAPVKGATKALG